MTTLPTIHIPTWARGTLYILALVLGLTLGILQLSGITQLTILGLTLTTKQMLATAGYLGIPTGLAALRYLSTTWQPYPDLPAQDTTAEPVDQAVSTAPVS
jgi:hypothetical protein